MTADREREETSATSAWKQHYHTALQAYRAGDFLLAERQYREALAGNVHCYKIYASRASLFARQHRFTEVAKDGRRMMELDETCPIGYLFACKAYRKLSEWKLARKAVERGIAACDKAHVKYGDLIEFRRELEQQEPRSDAAAEPPTKRRNTGAKTNENTNANAVVNSAFASVTTLARPRPGVDFLQLLPNELLRSIFELLPLRDIIASSRVSRAWRAYVTAECTLWSQLNFSAVAPTAARARLSNAQLALYVERARHRLAALHLSGCTSLTAPGLHPIVRSKCKELEVLVLDHMATSFNLEHLAEMLRKLLFVRRVEGARGPGLRVLSLVHHGAALDDAALASILIHCPALTDLRLNGNPHLRDFARRYHEEFERRKHRDRAVADEKMMALRTVHAAQCLKLGMGGITAVVELWSQTLTELDLRTEQPIAADVLLQIARCRLLEVLRIGHVVNAGSRLVRNVDDALLAWCGAAEEAGLALRELVFTGCPDVTDQGMVALLDAAPHVNTLSLENCSRLGDNTAHAIADTLAGTLRHLDVSHCLGISARGFIRMGDQCKLLETVNVSGCVNVSDVLFVKLARVSPAVAASTGSADGRRASDPETSSSTPATSSPITALQLNGCTQVTGVGVQVLVKNAPRLRLLEMNFCQRVRNEVVDGIRRGLPARAVFKVRLS